jgi:NADH dehydrogenase
LIVGLPLQQQRPVILIGEGRRKHTFVAMQDVAAFAVKAVGHPAAHNQTIVIGGPQAVSWQDILATFEAVLERPIPVETRAPGEQLPGLPPVVSENMAYLDTFDSPIDMGAATQTFGIKLTPLETWVRSYSVSIPA